MPTYQYACTTCDERLEVVQKFSDDPLTECSTCGGQLRKLFSPVGIVFKGSGFYRTDNRNGAANGAGKASKQNGSATTPETAGAAPGSGASSKAPGEANTAKKADAGATAGTSTAASKVA